MTLSKILDTAARKTESAFKQIEGYFNREEYYRTLRFDGFARSNDGSDDYYDELLHPTHARTRACVSVEWVAFNEIAQALTENAPDMVYIPCGISSGMRAHKAADFVNNNLPIGKKPYWTTYHVEEHIGHETHYDEVILPNKNDNLTRANAIGGMNPNKMMIAPVVREGAVRALKDVNFARNQRYEEEDYMAFWFPVIDRCKGMCLDGDWNYSRNSIWEMMRGVLIQAGQLPLRPKADMDVFDIEGRPVTLYARAEKLAETLRYQIGKGFEPREAATALAQIFMIDEELRNSTIKTTGSVVHSVLRDRLPEELDAMAQLKAEFEPVLMACAHYMRLDGLPDKYRKAAQKTEEANEAYKTDPATYPIKVIKKLQEDLGGIFDAFRKFASNISKHMLKILSVQTSDELLEKDAEQDRLPQRKFDSYERFFEKGASAKIFEDNLYSDLDEWQRIALPFAIGATETGLYPAEKPMATAIFVDRKRGKEGFRWAQAKKVHNMEQIENVLDHDMPEVVTANEREAETIKTEIKKQTPGKIVVNTLNFQHITDAIEHYRAMAGFVAAPGGSKTSPKMRLALQMKFLDRNVDRAVFQEGWQYSNDLVQLRVRARMIQAGQVERPIEQSKLHIYNADRPRAPVRLIDDIKLLKEEVERAAAAHVRAPEQALALARLIELRELLRDHTLQRSGTTQTRELISHHSVPLSLTSGDQEEADAVVNEARALLTNEETGIAWWIPYKRLHATPDGKDDGAKEVQNRQMQKYIDAQKDQRRIQWLAKQQPTTDEIEIEERGGRR